MDAAANPVDALRAEAARLLAGHVFGDDSLALPCVNWNAFFSPVTSHIQRCETLRSCSLSGWETTATARVPSGERRQARGWAMR